MPRACTASAPAATANRRASSSGPPLGEERGEGAGEAVARARRVHRVDARRRGGPRAVGGGRDRARRSQGHDDRAGDAADGGCRELAPGVERRARGIRADAHRARLVLVDHERIGRAERAGAHRGRRREVEHEAHARLLGEGRDAVDRGHGQLALREHEGGPGDALAFGLSGIWGQGEVRAAGDDDGVLAGVRDGDLRDAGRGVGDPRDGGGRQPEPLEGRQGEVARGIRADAGDEVDGCPDDVRGDGLVRSLAAERDLEAVRQDRLAGRGERGDVARGVDVERADDHDPAGGAHARPRVLVRRCCP